MRIALDATYSVGDALSGVGVYSREILTGLPAAHPEAEFLFCYRPHRFLRSLAAPVPGNCHRRLLADKWAPRSAAIFHGLNQRLPNARLKRAVSTFHDLFVMTAEYSSPEFRERFREQARHAAERSDLIVTVSQFTAGQVEEKLGIERSRLRVVHHGVRFPRKPPDEAARENVVLHVGAVQRRKNLLRLVEAFERLGPEWRLVMAGSFGYGAEEILNRIDRSARRESIQVLGYVSGKQLTRLYAGSRIFAFPSLDEGFGMPVLEAMAWGLPVVTSSRSALPEVAGDAALLVEPRDTDAIACALQTLAGDENVRETMIERGKQRARRFSWDAAIAKTWSVYGELL